MVGPPDVAIMSVLVLLIAAGGTVASGFLAAFVWAVRSGQFDDMATPAIRVLLDARRTPAFIGKQPGGGSAADPNLEPR